MNKIEKPAFITSTDWKILQEKYPSNIEEIIEKLNQNYPVQYLIGNVEFYNCLISVNENVLIPRFETELLVEKLLIKITEREIVKPKIVDLGTGSGCIAIALQKVLQTNIKAIDISKKALEVAKKNAELNNVNIDFQVEDINNIDLEGYDVIVSNPPYVSQNEIVGEETKYEPQNAIFADNDGLYYYEIIIKKIAKLTKKPYIVAFEIGMNEADFIITLATNYLKNFTGIIEKDYTNRNRYIFLIKNI